MGDKFQKLKTIVDWGNSCNHADPGYVRLH
jgi:hypothetical protein